MAQGENFETSLLDPQMLSESFLSRDAFDSEVINLVLFFKQLLDVFLGG